MNLKDKTSLFIVGYAFISIIIIGAYDVYAILNGGTEASISHTIMMWSYKYPAFTFVSGLGLGFILGHLFWQMTDTSGSKKITNFVKGKKTKLGDDSNIDVM